MNLNKQLYYKYLHMQKIHNIEDSKNRWAIKIKRGGTLVVLPLLVIGCKVLCYFTLNTFFVTARVPSV